MFQGNWIDFIIIIFILLYIWEGFQRGFIQLCFELLSFVGAFILALKLYPSVSKLLITNFALTQGLANAVSFLFLGLLFEQFFSYLVVKIEAKIPKKYLRHHLNRFLSIIPLFGNAVVIITFIVSLVLAFPLQSQVKQAVVESRLAQPLITQTQRIERLVTSIFGEALHDTFNFVTVQPVSDKSVALHFTQPNVTIDAVSEQQMLSLVNKERRDQGLAALVVNEKLRDLAREYARDMFRRGYFSHYNPEGQSPFERMEAVGITYHTAGENLAYAPSVAIAHQGLMDSPGHRANILSGEFGSVGIGVMDGGIYGKMFVQEFTD